MYEKLKYTIKRLEAEIEREKQMEESQRYFFAAASHELKTPIAGASALLEGMLEDVVDFKEYPETLRECLKLMNEQNKLVNEILEIVQLENNKVKFESEELNLRTTVMSVLQMFTALAEAKGQNILNKVPDGLYINNNKNMFKRVVSNVIMNAIQNTPEKGDIKIWTKDINGKIRLSVLNTGTRIPDDILPKLFEPFYRAGQQGRSEEGSSGLGLAICRQIVEQHAGRIAMRNLPGGICVDVALPVYTGL
jgi:two-component system sensor histidine kinase VanS